MPSFPIVIPASPGAAIGTPLATVRNRLADELGFWLVTTTTALAAGGEASRVVLASELRDDEAGYEFLGRWIYVRSGAQAGAQRRILDTPEVGYQGPRGALMLSSPFAAALQSGVTVEITGPLPVKRSGVIAGLNDCIGWALARIWIEARLPITGNGTYEYDLTDYPWLVRAEQIRGIYDTVWGGPGYPSELSPYAARIVSDGVNRTLVTRTSYTSDQTFSLSVIVRADRLVYDGSAWGYVPHASTPGLLSDTYQTAAPADWVHAFAMVMALRQIIKLLVSARGIDAETRKLLLADATERKQTWALAAARIKVHEFPKAIVPRTEPLITSGRVPTWT